MDNQENIGNNLKTELARLFFIAFGIFLFILFFQPFPLDTLNYNNRLLYVTGFGGITFVLCFLSLVLFPLVFPKLFKISDWESGPPAMLNLILLALTYTAYAFYVRFVGNTILSLYILFKIFLVNLMPIIILIILYKNKSLERIIEILKEQNKLYLKKIKEFEKNGTDEKVDIYSDSRTDYISLKFSDIISVQSADNYIELNYLVKGHAEKRLIRNTLKNIETLLMHRPEFIRCHRTRIVNLTFVEKLTRNYSGYGLKMKCITEDVPVSRQYLIFVKEAISALD